MPRYSRQVVGPSHLSSASGTPRAAQRETRVCRCCEHCSESGVPATKNIQVVVDVGDPLLDSCPLDSFG